MAKRVIVIASGETERKALPHLLAHLREEGIQVTADDIRTPPRSGLITGEMACKLILSAWNETRWSDPPSKFVVLQDADARDPRAIVEQLTQDLGRTRAQEVPVPILIAAAKWHLEAWFFADAAGLRAHLGRDLGSIDPSRPDEIINPKLHLKQILAGTTYTARVAEEIARKLSPERARSRSPSFAHFEQCVRNGPSAAPWPTAPP
ncbi:MAG TPA: DUF4276 family protein [Candidatus Nanopelagicales bacterium]|nr:DUF4276 family protein [Candidatus Nanopelagicales bacterium]